ncbi:MULTISPECIES: isoaspartyl peptidase/L-asparaginase [unclassified Thermoplasma]|uniref:isoaspartyl peptidase/L-asparaginase n=1 Tax=unclassified Thermoplasma TaxID=2684908 RepID=UPI000D8FF38E|nr:MULTISPECIES: isoaspartyl peptidase/L-asparaginase [unclassified Thermoplasma]PYB68641.1 asparaginase [Thermoplasma sp. Kam2015]
MRNVLLIHGGVGSDPSFNGRLNTYAETASEELSALDNAVRAVIKMEDDPDFNAGTGSVPRIDGSIQMDAAVMIPGHFGSVINIERVKNPILVARDVMAKSPHIMMTGDGAIRFARLMGYPDYDPMTEKARNLLKKFEEDVERNEIPDKFKIYFKYVKVHDTVGAVARVEGEFAGAVSTGGSFPMLRGRVGDSPIPGAGIYVGEKGAVVATGVGEEIAKNVLSFRIYSRIGTGKLYDIIKEEVDKFSVPVGIIAVDEKDYAYYANKPMAVGLKEF